VIDRIEVDREAHIREIFTGEGRMERIAVALEYSNAQVLIVL
jgi:hypothetical protein